MSATIKDIARETGLSIATISKYMNGATLREKNRVAIERAVKKLNYTVNEYARGLKSNKSRTIGVVIPELSNLFVTQIITKMEDILRAQGYSVMICDCHTDEKLECEAVRFLMGKMVDGIVNMPICRDGRHLKPALEKKIPIVLVDRTVDALTGLADSVLIDNAAAAKMATSYLLERGHREIGIIIGPEGVFTTTQRLKGYFDAFGTRGLTPDEANIQHGDYMLQGGYESMRRLLAEKKCTAVFVTNYEMTLGAVIAINEAGLKIPEEISIIGFDNMDLSRITHPRLTIVTQPLEQIGTQVAKLLLEHLTGSTPCAPVSISLSTTLQEGASVRRL
ncbi:MAG TPA: LacI family transcriptional regulator [Ruminococcaceae bacterium]|nr:LacI family transcriptional regulator [Oscillospiraceae bacterium]